jgi:pimeloyl-ACP methyl ester carboxylesterase
MANAKAGDLILKSGTYFNFTASFGILVVPENRSNWGSRLIRLPVIRIHSTASDPAEPVFFLTGGPGAKNVYPPSALLKAGQRNLGILEFLLDHHDLILVGYRGVDGSVVLNCPEIVDALRGKRHPLSRGNLELMGKALSAAHQRLTQEGVDIDGYSVAEVVDDLDAVRRAFHYERIDLWGGSYGATVAYLYGLKYPGHVRRIVLTGPQPSRFLDVWRPEIIDHLFRHYDLLWKADAKQTGRNPDLVGMLRRVLERMPYGSNGVNLDPDKVRILSFIFLADTGSAAQIFDAFASADAGDYCKLADLTAAYDQAFPSAVVWGDFYSKILSVHSPEPGRDIETEMAPEGSVLGSPLAKLLFGCLKYGRWPIRSVPDELRGPRYSDVETLLISGHLDFSSPVEPVKTDLLPYLRKGRLVVLSEMGHNDVAGRLQPRAFQNLVGTFFLTGEADDSRFTYQLMDFKPSQPFMKWLWSLKR